MQQSKTPPIRTIDFRADSYSPDGKNIIISFATKYVAERRIYSVPVECLNEFTADLQKLKPPAPTNGIETSGPSAIAPTPQPATAPIPTKDLNRVTITVPKRWMLRSGLPDHPLVIMVFDPQTEAQAGYALTAAAAREMAAGLLKYADGLANYQANNQKTNGNQRRTSENEE
jgi:hypothetical protein